MNTLQEITNSLGHVTSYPRPFSKGYYDVKLDSNESFYGCSSKVLQAIRSVAIEDISQYPAYGQLLQELSILNNVEMPWMTVTNGTDEAIRLLFELFTKPQGKVVILNPSFAMYTSNAEIFQNQLVQIPYKEGFVLPQEELLASINDTTQMVILANPNNPTGENLDLALLEKVLQKGVMTVVDEVYYNYGKGTAQNLLSQYKNLILLRSFSKDYGLAGLRIGYILADPSIITMINKLLCPYNVNSLAVIAAIAAVQDQDFLQETVSSVQNVREYLTNKLSLLGFKVYPSDSNFILIDCGASAPLIYGKLRQKRILVKKLTAPLLQNCLRVTIPNFVVADRILKSFMPYDTVIFDLDGVIADVSESYREAIRLTYEYFSGKKLLLTRIQKLKDAGGYNNDWKVTEKLLLDDGCTISYADVVQKFNQFYLGTEELQGLISNEKLLLPQEILASLVRRYKLAIFTGRPRVDTEIFLKQHNIQQYFQAVVTMDDLTINEQKPHPKGLQMILRQLHSVNPLYLGDSIDDAGAGISAQVDFIGISQKQENYSSNGQLLQDHGALQIIENIQDISDILLRGGVS